jgi:TolB-like protein/DNA-binding winged helix-turn-helix (wHTH) protein
MDAGVETPGFYHFGHFRLDMVGRTLARDGTRVHLAPRLFDTLVYLVENRGRLIERAELRQAIWQGRAVDDGNVLKAISSLRLAMKGADGDEIGIVNEPGRGYRFNARVTFEAAQPLLQQDGSAAAVPAADPRPAPPHVLKGRPSLLKALAAAAGLALIAFLAWHYAVPVSENKIEDPASFLPPPHSVAVLPFTNLGGGSNADYLSDGLSDEIINALGRIPGLRVAARMSSFSFKGRQVRIGDIGRQLNVGTVLEGSVQREGTSVRVTVQLIDAVTGFQLWSHDYDNDAKGLLAIEREIAVAVIGSLKIVLLGNDATRLTSGGTSNDHAFDSYLTGMAALRDTDEETNARAIAAFSDAIARDPTYALAYAQRAQALAYRAVAGDSHDIAENKNLLALALDDAQKAVALAPELGAGHAAMALVLKFSLSDFGAAYAQIKQALALSPGDAGTLMSYGFFELDVGHLNAAIAAGRRAASLDPLTPGTYKALSEMLSYARQFDDALREFRRAKALRPADTANDRIYTSYIEQLDGNAKAARETCAGARDWHDMACLAWADHALGRQAEAEAALQKLHALLGDDGAYLYARIAAQWGRQDDALRWLQTAYRLRDAGLIAMRIDPFLDPVRQTQVYRDIESALRFPK